MSRPLILLAASGLAREVLASLARGSDYEVCGILDDSPQLQGTAVGGVAVLGTIDQVTEHPGAQLLISAGNGRSRSTIADRLDRLGVGDGRFATVVDHSAVVSSTSTVREGSILLAHTVLTADVRLGRHVVVMPNVTLTHDNQVDDFATLCAGVSLGGHVRVGRAAYLGMNSCARENTVIGPASVLGMGAVLLQNLPAGQTWTGVPATARWRGDSNATSIHNIDCQSVS